MQILKKILKYFGIINICIIFAHKLKNNIKMKKIIIAFIVLFMLSSFTFKVENNGEFAVKYNVLNINNMDYMVFYNKYTRSSGSVSTAVAVVNITKDKLEVEKTKLEIEYLKKQLNKK